jgi:hypothetical protein
MFCIDCLSHNVEQYVWFRGGNLNSFRDIQQISRFGGVGVVDPNVPYLMYYIHVYCLSHKD